MCGVWDMVSLRHSWNSRRGCPEGKWIQSSRALEKIRDWRYGFGSQIWMLIKAMRDKRFPGGTLGHD